MGKVFSVGVITVASTIAGALYAGSHGFHGSVPEARSVTSVRHFAAGRPLAETGHAATYKKTTTTYGYALPQPVGAPGLSTGPWSSPWTSPSTGYTSMYYPSYYPGVSNSCYSCLYNGTTNSNPYGFSYTLPAPAYPMYPSFSAGGGYPRPIPTFAPSYPGVSSPYAPYSITPSYPSYAANAYSSSPYGNNSAGALQPYISKSSGFAYYPYGLYYPYGASGSRPMPYGATSGYFGPTGGSYSGPYGSMYFNSVPGYAGGY